MSSGKPSAKDVPEHILDQIALEVYKGLGEFYANPENERGFQEWKAERDRARAEGMARVEA